MLRTINSPWNATKKATKKFYSESALILRRI